MIFKEGLTVRGLTTAASIWITAAIGILIGIGFYFAASVGGAATLAILAAFRFIELRLPTEFYAHHSLTFERGAAMTEDDLRRLIGEHGFSIANLSYRLSHGGKLFEYGMVIKTRDRRNAEALSGICANSGSARVPDRADGRLTTARPLQSASGQYPPRRALDTACASGARSTWVAGLASLLSPPLPSSLS